jgi:hypothetical protein
MDHDFVLFFMKDAILSAKIGKKSLKFVGLLGFSEAQPKNATAF